MEKLNDLFSMVCHCEDTEKRREWLLYVRSEARKLLTADAYELLRKTYVLGAQDGNFDDYCIALEWYRAPEKRFYLPRRAVLKPLVDDLQDLFDGELDFLGVSLPPRVGKSTLCIFFMTFVMGHRIVDEKLRADGVRVNMSYKKAPTNQSKLSRIIQYAPDIKKFYFIDGKHRSAEYEKFMRELTLFTVSGKNLHDDAPDACAMLVDFLVGGIKTVTVARRPF